MTAAAATRYFIDSLITTGDIYMIPADKREAWQAFDVLCEETSEDLPIPDYARPIKSVLHVEFENPTEVM